MRLLWFGVAGGVLSLGALFSARHLVFDLISHFRVQYIVLLLLFICLALYKKRFVIVVALAMCLGVHGHAVFQSQTVTIPTVTGVSQSLRVMSSNLLVSNTDANGHIQYIESIDPDIVVFQEYTGHWDAVLSKALLDYEHKQYGKSANIENAQCKSSRSCR